MRDRKMLEKKNSQVSFIMNVSNKYTDRTKRE